MKTQEIKKEILKKIELLEKERYKIVIVVGSPFCGKTSLAKEITKKEKGEYIDYLKDVLSHLQSPTLGAFGLQDFIDDLKNRVNSTSGELLIIDEMEGLFSTWSKKQIKELPRLLSNMATRVKVVLFVRKPCKWVEAIKRMSSGDSRIVEIG